MFPEMRRKKQQLSPEACIAILDRGTSGILALCGDDGWPYAVPLSYAYEEGKLLFHCAKAGHKLDALRQEPRASFCVIHQDQVVPQEFTTYYQSVILFGTVRILADQEEIGEKAKALGRKYCPGETSEALEKEISGALGRMYLLEMTVEHMTGKQARELVGQ